MEAEQPKERKRIVFENDANAILSQLPVAQKRGRKAKSKTGTLKKESFSFDSATRVLLFCLCEKLQMDKSALGSLLIQERAKLEGISVKL